jgi:hypothetical protein
MREIFPTGVVKLNHYLSFDCVFGSVPIKACNVLILPRSVFRHALVEQQFCRALLPAAEHARGRGMAAPAKRAKIVPRYRAKKRWFIRGAAKESTPLFS